MIRRFVTAMRRAQRVRRETARDSRALSFYRPFVARRALCFDVGANIGQETGVFLRLGARVVAVEPDPDAALALRLAFGWSPRLTIVRAAVSDRAGTAKLHRTGTSTPLSTIVPPMAERGERWDSPLDVPMTSLDELAARFGVPDAVKLDIEGSEAAAVRGMSFAPAFLQFEHWQLTPADSLSCLQRFASLVDGTVLGNLSPANRFELALPHWVEPGQLTARLATTDHAADVFLRRAH